MAYAPTVRLSIRWIIAIVMLVAGLGSMFVGNLHGPLHTLVYWTVVGAVIVQAAVAFREHASRKKARKEFLSDISDILTPLLYSMKGVPISGPLPERQSAVSALLAEAVSACKGLTDAERVRVTVYQVKHEDGSRYFSPWMTVGRSDRPVSIFREDDTVEGEYVWRNAINETPTYVYDKDAKPLVEGFDYDRKRPYRTYITVPIVLSGEPVALLTINAPEPGDLSEADAAMMQAVADIIGTGLRSLGGKFPPRG